MSNCVLTRASNASRTFSGLGAFICGGTMTHCVLHTFTPQNDCGYGYAVRVRNGGLLSHCVVSNAYTGTQKQHQSTQKSAIVLIDGGEVRNCLIVDNHVLHASLTAGNRYVGGVSLLDSDSRLVSSTVIGNSVNLTDDLAAQGR